MERKRLDLRELELLVRRVHSFDLLLSWRAKPFNYFYKLINGVIAGENRLREEELAHDAADRPDVDLVGVFLVSKDKLWRSVVP